QAAIIAAQIQRRVRPLHPAGVSFSPLPPEIRALPHLNCPMTAEDDRIAHSVKTQAKSPETSRRACSAQGSAPVQTQRDLIRSTPEMLAALKSPELAPISCSSVIYRVKGG
ncbi:MAG: hypothetical protein ABUS57_17135, partial [Pseudomonadota bacterium]